ncbi:hypothetical protein M378DRAFT_1051573 [Amanita muscaria Koide BX008]|uniref:Uncharacterized protein n=1 Tax=Amanita muscaria (strain Koide BX008) TaxID=946122 RepID=A0A0C2SLK2_AMAMK|nr:hypothetical protein M378DRAFT_1051573 [Amanita muscaria Koide BX008]
MCVAADVVGTTISQCYQYQSSRILLQAPTRLTVCVTITNLLSLTMLHAGLSLQLYGSGSTLSHQKWSKPCGHQCTSSSSSQVHLVQEGGAAPSAM